MHLASRLEAARLSRSRELEAGSWKLISTVNFCLSGVVVLAPAGATVPAGASSRRHWRRWRAELDRRRRPARMKIHQAKLARLFVKLARLLACRAGALRPDWNGMRHTEEARSLE